VNESEEDREVRKRIAEDAAGQPLQATIFTRAFQFFLVPLLIVLACVGVYWLFSVTMTDQRTPEDWMRELRRSGPGAREHAAAQLVAELRRQVSKGQRDLSLVAPLIETFQSVAVREDQGTDPITRTLVGEGPSMRAILASCLGLLGDKRATPVLLDALREEENLETKAAIIDALGALRDPDAAPDLIKLLDHPSSVVRKYATFTLGALAAPREEGGPPSVPSAVGPLKGRLEDPRAEVQWNAAFVLAYFLRDGSGVPVLRRMLDRKHVTDIVTSSSKETGDRKAADNTPVLVAHALRMACNAQARLREPALVEPVRALESDPDGDVRTAARAASAAAGKDGAR
jgi:HEAT repeat protein